MFVLLQLKTHGKAIGDDGLGKLLLREGCLTGGHGLEFVMLLVSHQWVHPRKKHFALVVYLSQLRFGPFVIFAGADYAFHFVAWPKVFEIAFEISFLFAAAGAF